MSDNTVPAITSNQFTEVLVEHLMAAMSAIPSHHTGGVSSEGLLAHLQSQLGVARRSTPVVLACLTQLELVTEVGGLVGRSSRGDKLRRELRDLGGQAMVLMIIRSGFMADQIRNLRPILTPENDGYRCGRSAAQAAAPQLVGLLGRLPDVAVSGRLLIGRDTGLELDSVWNELTPDSRIDWQDIQKRRKAIGDRAELYSLQLERSSHVGALDQITWVSRDDDSLGYDIEVASTRTRRIEVKGSTGRDVQFFMSANEYRVSERYRGDYELHYWGEINLLRDPRDDYERLSSAGYPIRVQDPFDALSIQPWVIEPSQYRVRRPSL